MTEFAIEIEKLTKNYKKSSRSSAKLALDAIDLKIKKGSFFGLLGPNGAGKSTIINILAGLVNKTSGMVKIAGINIDENALASKFKIGIVPQELIIDPFFTVRETLEIYAGYFGVRKNERRTDEIIEALGLKDKADVKPRGLSGGMKRRLLVAKALVNNPEILVLDEPTAGVDVELRSQLWKYVKALNARGTTIVLTTHYLEEAEQLCDEIAIINKGKIIAHDKKANLINLLSEKQITIIFNKEVDCKQMNMPQNVDFAQLTPDKISVIYDPNKVEIAEIFTQITKNAKNDVKIIDILTKQPDLEEVFKHLVR